MNYIVARANGWLPGLRDALDGPGRPAAQRQSREPPGSPYAQVQDEAWRVDGVKHPDLPSPANSGNLPPGAVYANTTGVGYVTVGDSERTIRMGGELALATYPG